MSYSFRIRIKLPQRLRIGIESDRWALTPKGTLPEISLRSKNQGTAISASADLVFRGDGYQSEEQAHSAAEELRDVIIMAFARMRIGADFGDRAPKGWVTEAGLKMLQQDSGHERVLNDVHGLMLFKTDPPAHFANLQADYVLTKGQEKFIESLQVAHGLHHRMPTEHRLAFDLFSASFFKPSADARLLMLMMGVETLLKPDLRSTATQKHVRKLICRTKLNFHLPRGERESLAGSLQLLLRESISQAGRRLSTRLGSQKYLDMSAPKFFTYCYDLRSKIAHGHVPRPNREEVDKAAANLEAFLGDLLSGPLFEKVSPANVTQIQSLSHSG
jgi:hypothetical protein